jgi:uncharacterized repeat protein (TIGR01451 family)
MENTLFQYSGVASLAALAEEIRPATVLITELDPGTSDQVEFTNLTSSDADVAGWQISIYDVVSWPKPRFAYTIPSSNSVVPPRKAFTLRKGGTAPGRLPYLMAGNDIAWGNKPSNSVAAVLLRNSRGAIVDFACFGDAFPGQITEPLPIPLAEWYGQPRAAISSSWTTYQRIGTADHQSRDDWTTASGSLGSLNANCASAFLDGVGSLRVNPSLTSSFVDGIWSGTITLEELAELVTLIADDRMGHTGKIGPLRVESQPPVEILVPHRADEGAGQLSGEGEVVLRFPLTTNLLVSLSSTQPDLVSVPEFIAISAGCTNARFDLFIGNNDLLDGTRFAQVSASAEGFARTWQDLGVRDDELAVLSLQLPMQAREGDGPLLATLSVDRKVSCDCLVDLTVSDSMQVVMPGQIIIPAGRSNVTFQVWIVDDQLIETNTVIILGAEVANWTSAQAELLLLDNEDRNLRLNLPFTVNPLEAVVKGGAQVGLSGFLSSPLTIALSTLPRGGLSFPRSVVIPAGQTNVSFDLGPVTNTDFQGLHTVVVEADAPGFASASALVEVADQELIKIPMTIADLAYDAKARRIYASVVATAAESNAIAIIEPMAGIVKTNIPLGKTPSVIALTDDGSFLYVALNEISAIQRIDLGTYAAEAPFSLAGGTAAQIAAVPGRAGQVIVRRLYNQQGSMSAQLYLYENGQPLVNAAPDVVTFAATGKQQTWTSFSQNLYGPGDMINQIVADESGLHILKSASFPLGVITPWVEAGGLLYNAVGRIANPETLVELPGIAGATGQFVAADFAHQRIFFFGDLARVTGGTIGTLFLSEADLATRLMGKALRFKYTRNYNSLLRWGENGLAFGIDDQLHLLRSSLIPQDLPAELQINQFVQTMPLIVGSNCTITTLVSNAGPAIATSVLLTENIPSELTFLSAWVSQGTVTNRRGTLTCELGHLTNGAVATVTLVLQAQKAGIFNLTSTVRATQQDADTTNNRVTLDLPVQYPDVRDSINQVMMSASDIIFDSASQRLFATVPENATRFANNLVQINPANGAIEAHWLLGSDPGILAKSDNEQYLYAALDGQASIVSFHLPSRSVGVAFSWGTNDANPVSRVTDLKVFPGKPDLIVAALAHGETASALATIRIFDHGVPREKTIESGTIIGISSDGKTGYTQYVPFQSNFDRLKVSELGVELLESTPNLFGGLYFEVVGDRLYAGSGQVISLNTLKQEQQFPQLAVVGLVLPMLEKGRLFFLTPAGPGSYVMQLTAYDSISCQLLEMLYNGLIYGSATRLVHCGSDRLAFCTTGGQIFFVRTSLIPLSPETDLAVQWDKTPDPVLLGSEGVFNVVISNGGSNAAENVRFTLDFPASIWAINVAVSQGSFINANTVVNGYLGNILPAQNARATITAKSANAGLFPVSIRVFSSSLEFNTSNNFGALTVRFGSKPAVDQTVALDLPNNGLVYDACSRRLFASVPASLAGTIMGDSIVSIDPARGVVSPPLYVGAEPGALAVSPDGRQLCVALGGDNAIQQVNLESWSLGNKYSLPAGSPVSDIAFVPGQAYRLMYVKDLNLYWTARVWKPERPFSHPAFVPMWFRCPAPIASFTFQV